MTNTFSLLQGNIYQKLNEQKSSRTIDKSSYSGSVIEGFSGFGPTKATTRNVQESKETQSVRDNFSKAVSKYGAAQKQLMSETNLFINNSSNSGKAASYRNKLIRLQEGTLGYVTDRNTFKYIESDDILESIRGKNGCPAAVTDVNFSSDKYLDIGNTLGTDPDLFVGTPMSMNESCAPASINIQVLGASDPVKNKANWLGCFNRTSDYFTKQDDLDGSLSANDAISRCQRRAADTGASTFYIGSEPDNSYSCFTSNIGMTTVQIQAGMTPGVIQKISSVVHSANLPASTSWSGAGIMNNGQIALGNVPAGTSNFGMSVETPSVWSVKGFDNCNPGFGAKIVIQSANYGANCNGKTSNADAMAAAVPDSITQS